MIVNHLPHLEDLIFEDYDKTINVLKDLSDHRGSTTLKWDGAPSIFMGRDRDGKFFVSTKSIFNKTPVRYYNKEQITSSVKEGLAEKLVPLIELVHTLGIEGVIQGDLLYTSGPDVELINGSEYMTFQPNVIKYAYPGNYIVSADIGIAVHTAYDYDMNLLPHAPNVEGNPAFWLPSCDVESTDVSDAVEPIIETLLEHRGSPPRFSGGFKGHLLKELRIYINSRVRDMNTSQKTVDDFLKWSSARKIPVHISHIDKTDFQTLFDLHDQIAVAKHHVINRLNNKVKGPETFVQTKDGLKETKHEGFVFRNHGGEIVKLVDRMEFSYNNFSPEIIRGWN